VKRVNFKPKFWRYATFFAVLLLVANPEMIQLGLFVDAVGLDLFILLLGLQVSTLFQIFFSRHVKPKIGRIRHFLIYRMSSSSLHFLVRTTIAAYDLILTPATIMHLLVLSAVAGVMLNVH